MTRSALAPAKLNLFLHVGPPGEDGYHPLCSLMAFADLGDLVTATEAGALGLKVRGRFADQLGSDTDNLVLRAARALIARVRGPVAPVELTLEKRLPVAAGLGGGSSDAGAALRLLREACRVRLDDSALQEVAAGLGADGAACLWGRPVVAEGQGDRLSPAPGLPTLHAVLVNPGPPVSTAAVYRQFDALGAFGDVRRPAMPEAFESAAELAAWLAAQRNDLERAAIEVAPAVGDVLDTLAGERETLLARVSGSGGTCFALCDSDIEAESLAERIEAMEPDWWVARCRLGGPWPSAA